MNRVSLLLVLAFFVRIGFAGGGAETLLVIANGDSPLSLLVAREYMQLRGIPEEHLLVLHGISNLEVISVAEMRERILKPIEAFLAAHQLADEIDGIAYSADLPYGIDFVADLGDRQPTQVTGNLASLTGMTYLGARVLAADTSYLDLAINRYYRGPRARTPTEAERKLFEAANGAIQAKDYAAAAKAYEQFTATYATDGGSWYNLACCLAILGRGDAALGALERAAEHGWRDAKFAQADPDLKSLLGQPRFDKLLKGMEVPRPLALAPTRGFRADCAWGDTGEPDLKAAPASPDRYRLATMLAYTGERGNSLPEVRAYLRAAASCDGSSPPGTVYFCKNGDVRSTTREAYFAPIAAALAAIGHSGAVLVEGADGQDGILPQGRKDVIGAVIGRADFDWSRSASTMLPGAICEHLTSFGAAFRINGQTKLSELMRHGAAGSSGAVTEPLALFGKFPSPAIHLHYAEGASLAEAFYQSVAGPYQLLIVGDPLARPFARFAAVSVTEPAAGDGLSGVVSVRAQVGESKEHPLDRVELWVDGERLARAAPGEPLSWDTAASEDGSHELRVVAVDATAVESRSSSTPVLVNVDNHGRKIAVKAPTAGIPLGAAIELSGSAPGATGVEVRRGYEVLAQAAVKEGQWQLSVPSALIGVGKADLYARVTFAEGLASRGPRIAIEIVEGPVQAAAPAPSSATLPGLSGEAVAAGGTRFVGEFEVKADGFHELTLSTRGVLRVSVAGQVRHEGQRGHGDGVLALPLFLSAGWHAIELHLEPEKAPAPALQLSGTELATPLGGARLRYQLAGRTRAETPTVLSGANPKGAPLATLTDGARDGASAVVPTEGLVLTWKKPAKQIATVILYPDQQAKGVWPAEWQVATATGSGFKEVRKLQVTVGPAMVRDGAPAATPEWVRLDFAPITTKALRVLPKQAVSGLALQELDALRGR